MQPEISCCFLITAQIVGLCTGFGNHSELSAELGGDAWNQFSRVMLSIILIEFSKIKSIMECR
jgi:hypothetical protein